MSAKKLGSVFVLLGLFLALASSAPAATTPAPVWTVDSYTLPSHLEPGSTGNEILIVATNQGAKPAAVATAATLTATLPAGLTITEVGASGNEIEVPGPVCETDGHTATCTTSGEVPPGYLIEQKLKVSADNLPPGTELQGQATIAGGGASAATTEISARIDTTPPPFGILPGFSAALYGSDGSATTQAASHPHQLSVKLSFPTKKQNKKLYGAGYLHDAVTDLPPGTLINPSATPVLCTEAQLTVLSCPDESAIGIVTLITSASVVQTGPSPLYNMVPPDGVPAEFAFDALGVGVFVHIAGAVRSDGDYGLSGASRDALALPFHPVFGVRLDFWGDPSDPAHDRARGGCQFSTKADICQVERETTAFLTAAGRCTGQPSVATARADSWEGLGDFKSATYESADLEGNPVALTGCNALEFKPVISVRPTTNLIDSPSGLDVDLSQPQETSLEGLSTAALKDATVTLPAGLTVNPSQADGLAACSLAEIGYAPKEGQVHFDKTPARCPDAAKIGSMEVTSPLLAETDESGTKIQHDPETGAVIPRPLHGSVYLAQPFDNPFGSLLAIYLAIEDPRSGTVAKLAGQVIPDPQTGQLTTRFTENPELPLEDIRLHLFGGARGSLITPPVCGTHTTTSDLVPWSTPEGADATPSGSFQTTAAPGGGACPTAVGQAPNAPAFTAGTISPQAGAFSPFALKLSREDGSQRLTGIDTLLPPGLTGKLAGIAQCSEAALAAATARSKPDEGVLERRSPSCPASSEVGVVNVAAGAGPTPFYTQGHAYLAGPYKGAPLSLAIITPAIAGPFDLGTVVVRTALYVDPRSARIHAVSDPFPQILDGIPLDLRSVALQMNRPGFILNPTSCNRFAITGNATSALGQAAGLTTPFQVGGCSALKFKPKLAIKLTGGTKRSKNPALKATLTLPPGGANIAKASVALPHSEFLDQSHIRTVCTRVQFAAAGGSGAGCPPGSVYGRARAITPLLDSALEGPVFLRANPEHELPDLVAALNGQIAVELVGRIDSVKGGIRTTFEGVPDAPVSKFVLEMQGGKKGLLENSVNLCKSTNRATALFDGQNGKAHDFNPVVGNSCKRSGGPKRGQDR